MNTPLGSLLNLERQVRDAVVAASGRLAEDWQARKSVSFKAVADPVTEHDIAIENALRQRLEELLPQAGFIVEEGESVRSEQYNWVIDPIDQTKNFIGQTPMFFTQVALVEDGTPILGVIYNPVSRQLLSASRGNGATMNGNPVAQIKEQALSEVVVDVDFGDSSHLTWKIQIIEKVARSASRLRITGGAYAPYLLVA